MAPSQAQTNPSPRPANTAGPSTASSSTTSPTGTNSTVATTVGAGRSWDEDKSLNLYILDYCRRRKFDETASAFEREAKITQGITNRFEAPQGLLFEWWIVFWETFNSQIAQLPSSRDPNSGPQGESSGQTYVTTMARLKKLAMHEKDELTRTRGMSVNMGGGGMGGPPMNGMHPQPGSIPGGMRPPSQASARSQSQQPQRPPPQMSNMHMTPNMAHTPTHTASTPTPAPSNNNVSSPSPIPTPPQQQQQQQQSFPSQQQQQPFGNPGSVQSSFGPGSQQGPGGGQQPMMHQGYPHPPPPPPPQQTGPGQQSFPSGPPGPGQQFPPGPGGPFQPGGSGAPSGAGNGGAGGAFQPNPNPQQQPQQPQNFPPGSNGGPGSFGPGPGGFPGPGGQQQFSRDGMPEWAHRPPPMGPQQPQQQQQPGRRDGGVGGWEDAGRPGPGQGMPPGMRPGPGGMMPQKPGGPGGPPPGMGMQPRNMMGGPHPGMQPQQQQPQLRGYPPGMMSHGMMGGPPQHMGPGGGMPPQQQQPMGQSPKEGSRSNTPATGPGAAWSPAGGNETIGMQRRPAVAAQGGQMGPSGPQGRPPFMGPGPGQGGPGGMGPGQGGMGQGMGGVGQKRPGSPPPPQTTTNLGGSPPDAKRPRPNDPGPATLAEGRPTSAKGPPPGMSPFGGPPPQQQQGMMNGPIQEYKQEIAAAMSRQAIVSQGPQPPPFGNNKNKPNGAGPGGQRPGGPVGAPSPASGEPRQVMNVKGAATGSMGPPASPSLANRMVGGVKKSESAGSSPALASSSVPNGMPGGSGDRSRTPSSVIKPPSPRTRPQSATPTASNPAIPPPPPNSAPPMLSQSPSNGMPYNSRSGPGQNGIPGDFDFGPMIDFSQLTSEFLPDDVNQMFDLSTLNDWPSDPALGAE